MPVSTQGTLLDGRYRVIRHLGSGGMASVSLCQDERLDRQVAVKRLHADSPADVEKRFVREAKLGASLNHPNLVAVFDTAIDDEGVLIVMEYVPGEPLSRALREGPLGPRRVGTLAGEIGAALDHAHEHGVVHRDVKPANVLLRNDGVTKLVDLGIATAADGTRITRSGTVLGTAAYMAPEQLEGRDPGPAVDVYALAAVCFEALSGRRPREGATPVQIAHSIASDPPPDLGEHWPAAPPAATELLRRGMARDPAERPASAGDLGRGLKHALAELTPRRPAPVIPARPGPPAPPAGDGRQAGGPRTPGSPRLALILAALMLALAVAVAVFALGSGDDGGGESTGQSAPAPEQADRPPKAKKAKEAGRRDEEAAQAPDQPAPTPPAEPQAEPPAGGGADGEATGAGGGAELNRQGFELLNAGSYEEAVPVLQQAVASFPPGTDDLNYAYALFNLGKALRLAGRPQDAIPVLEQRLAIPNQTGVVKRELALAQRAAAGG